MQQYFLGQTCGAEVTQIAWHSIRHTALLTMTTKAMTICSSIVPPLPELPCLLSNPTQLAGVLLAFSPWQRHLMRGECTLTTPRTEVLWSAHQHSWKKQRDLDILNRRISDILGRNRAVTQRRMGHQTMGLGGISSPLLSHTHTHRCDFR